jgi:NADPH-dependent 2,4-dienoyl-CoA reductase/sulfur reductase-like enzyme
VGREGRFADAPADGVRRVLVVGGGPAGLAAAQAAARRGHEVALVERDERLGGRLGLVAGGPAEELLESVRFAERELERLGVRPQLGVTADARLLEEQRPDVVVVATGARPAPDTVPAGDGSVPVRALDDALREDADGRRLLVVDHVGNEEVVTAAEQLAAAGARVLFVTPMPTVGMYIGFTRIADQLRRLYALGCELLTTRQLVGIENGEALLRHVHARTVERRAVDAVVAGVPGRPDLSVVAAAQAVGARVLVAGDATAPRTALHAFREGDDAGRAA